MLPWTRATAHLAADVLVIGAMQATAMTPTHEFTRHDFQAPWGLGKLGMPVPNQQHKSDGAWLGLVP